jgi:hypothetical protein
MHAPILLSMFQCVATVESSFTIRTIHQRLLDNKAVKMLIARPPGSLGKTIAQADLAATRIGSLHFKITIHETNVSVIVFDNLKVKISGGLQKMELFDSTDEFWAFVSHALVTPCLGQVFSSKTEFVIKTGMVNASCRLGKRLSFNDYLEKVDQLRKLKDKVIILPKCFSDERRGRLCSVRIKRADKLGTLIVDHHLTLQAFAYRDMNVLQKDVAEVKALLVANPLR